jgi:hypothetical protein
MKRLRDDEKMKKWRRWMVNINHLSEREGAAMLTA